MNLVEQIFAQAQIGGHAPTGNPFAEGLRIGQEQQRINLANRQFAQEMAQWQVQSTLLEQQKQLNALKLSDAMDKRKATVDNEQVYQDLSSVVSSHMLNDDPEAAEAAIWEAVGKNKGLWRHEGIKTMQEDVRAGATAKMELARIRGGKITAHEEDASTLNSLQEAVMAAERSGDPTAIANAKRKLENFSALIARDTETIYDPATGNPIFQRGPGAAGGITTATKTELTRQEMSNEEALSTLGDAISGIEANPSAIGIRGIAGSAIEKVRGQISPTANLATPITDTRQKASIAFSRIAPALRVDSGNMSKYELNKLEQAGDVLSAEEAPQTALNKLRNLNAVVVARQLRNLRKQNKPIPDTVLRSVQGEEIAGLLGEGLLTPQQALRVKELYDLNHGR